MVVTTWALFVPAEIGRLFLKNGVSHMDYSRKVAQLNKQFDLKLDAPAQEKIAVRLAAIKASHTDDQDWIAAMDSVYRHLTQNPLAIEAKKKALAVNQMCPVCGDAGEEITLMGGRGAYYCRAHRTVLPKVKE